MLAPTGGPLTPLAPDHPRDTHRPRILDYYEVDLTIQSATHHISLPSSGRRPFPAVAELSWHVDDPATFLGSETSNVSAVLLAHFLKEAARVTRRYTLERGAAAQQALRSGLRQWPVPGLAVTCAVALAPDRGPMPRPRPLLPPDSPSVELPLEVDPVPLPATHLPLYNPFTSLLREAETVLIGFDGPLTRLFTTKTARAAALDLLTLVTEHRHPDEALEGRPLGPTQEEALHPLDVLRAFADSGVAQTLRRRLDDLELRAVPHTHPSPDAHALIRALTAAARRVEIVTDVSEPAVQRWLSHHGIPPTGVHGRSDDLARLMPNPDCLLRALPNPGRPAPTGLLITSSVAEYTAATRLGLRCIGFADIPATGRRLRKAGCEEVVSSLEPLLDAARAL